MGISKLHIRTFGCQMNEYDSNKMTDVLKNSHNLELTDDADDAVIRRRFEIYELETSPVLGAYEASLIAPVDGLGTPAEVLLRILQAIVPSVAKSGAKPTA